jgi:PIN domain nuclease of toxin-antitoxin system
VRNYFLDSSALVKVYSEEDGSNRVRAMLRGLTTVPAISRVVVSVLAHPETASALSQIMAVPMRRSGDSVPLIGESCRR